MWYIIAISVVVLVIIVIWMLARKSATGSHSSASSIPPSIEGVETPETKDDSYNYDRDETGQECAHSVSVYCGKGRGPYYG